MMQQLSLDLIGGSLVEPQVPVKDIGQGGLSRAVFANTLDFWAAELQRNSSLAVPIGLGRRMSDGQLFSVNMSDSGNPWPTLGEAILECKGKCSRFHAERLARFCEWLQGRGAHTALTEIAIGVQIYHGRNGWYAACSKTILR